MKRMHGGVLLAGLLAGLLAAAVFGGCDKKVDLVFHNDTARAVNVTFDAPPMGTQMTGPIWSGSAAKRTVRIPREDLPAQCSYRADTGQPIPFTITERTAGRLHFRIDDVFGPSGPLDKDTRVRRQREVITEPIRTGQQEVVE